MPSFAITSSAHYDAAAAATPAGITGAQFANAVSAAKSVQNSELGGAVSTQKLVSDFVKTFNSTLSQETGKTQNFSGNQIAAAEDVATATGKSAAGASFLNRDAGNAVEVAQVIANALKPSNSGVGGQKLYLFAAQ
jgi:hypothetical protein